MEEFIDFDRFIAERERKKLTVRIFGRDCQVPSELPWSYVLKVDAMLRGGPNISGAENLALLRRMFSAEDYAFIVGHPNFRASYVWELIARTWLHTGDNVGHEPEGTFHTEDELKIQESRKNSSKKEESAR